MGPQLKNTSQSHLKGQTQCHWKEQNWKLCRHDFQRNVPTQHQTCLAWALCETALGLCKVELPVWETPRAGYHEHKIKIDALIAATYLGSVQQVQPQEDAFCASGTLLSATSKLYKSASCAAVGLEEPPCVLQSLGWQVGAATVRLQTPTWDLFPPLSSTSDPTLKRAKQRTFHIRSLCWIYE